MTVTTRPDDQEVPMPDTEPTTVCMVAGCNSPATRKGMCRPHRQRLQRYGNPDHYPEANDYPQARFWSKVEVRGPATCWPWQGTVLSNGYGQHSSAGGKHLAHRFAYELAVGPIPEGLQIDHVAARGCVRKDCVNPNHLEPVTPRENTMRADGPSAQAARTERCARGHEYDSVQRADGTRRRLCRECMNAASRKWHAAKRAARAEHQEQA